jgi:hypothetical protein
MTQGKLQDAFSAVRTAEANGGGNSSTNGVRSALVDKANDFLTQAKDEKDPAAKKALLQKILTITDGKANVNAKAKAELAKL